jgi:hypothetical protein
MRTFVFCAAMLLCANVHAERILIPPVKVVRIAETLAYPDFPTKLDILAICRVESGYKVNAVNPETSASHPFNTASNGIMQVQGGPFELRANMAQGVAMLRENYKATGSREGAVKAYNIGLYGYTHGHAKISAAVYWGKFKSRKFELERLKWQ